LQSRDIQKSNELIVSQGITAWVNSMLPKASTTGLMHDQCPLFHAVRLNLPQMTGHELIGAETTMRAAAPRNLRSSPEHKGFPHLTVTPEYR
jgi:hypothetical protein